MKKQIIATTIILLFIGVSVAPSINTSVVKASQDDDLVEVTTQACGIKGYGDTTVKLTREQYQNLEQYLVDFRARLNQTSTREEAVPIFKEAVVELDKYGLLPKGMSVEQAQKLVLRMYLNVKNTELIEKMLSGNQEKGALSNFFCLVTGSMTDIHCCGAFFLFFQPFLHFIVFLYDHGLLFANGAILIFIVTLKFSTTLAFYRGIYSPEYLFGEITFGGFYWDYWGSGHYFSSYGWISSNGILGFYNWSGNFYGQIRTLYFDGGRSVDSYYSGILGFTGLKIRQADSDYFIGSCLRLKLGPSHP